MISVSFEQGEKGRQAWDNLYADGSDLDDEWEMSSTLTLFDDFLTLF